MMLPSESFSRPSTPGLKRNLLIFDRCRLVSEAQVPPGPANFFAIRSASASAASTRAADFFASIGQSTRAGGVIAADSPAGGAAGTSGGVAGVRAGACVVIAGLVGDCGSSKGTGNR